MSRATAAPRPYQAAVPLKLKPDCRQSDRPARKLLQFHLRPTVPPHRCARDSDDPDPAPAASGPTVRRSRLNPALQGWQSSPDASGLHAARGTARDSHRSLDMRRAGIVHRGERLHIESRNPYRCDCEGWRKSPVCVRCETYRTLIEYVWDSRILESTEPGQRTATL